MSELMPAAMHAALAIQTDDMRALRAELAAARKRIAELEAQIKALQSSSKEHLK